jgi:hypothetical protein
MTTRFSFLWLILAFPLHVAAESGASESASETQIKQRAAELRLGLENWTLPGDETMGTVGVSYLLEVSPGIYMGPSVYGAASGKRGGFFSGGGEAALRVPLFSRLDLEAGLYVGGGGGGTAPVGSGLMLRPHVDLTWNFGAVRAGVSASSVYFPDGDIRSNQLGLVVSFDDRFFYTDVEHVGESTSTDVRGGIGFDRIAVLVGTYRPRSGITDTDGRTATANIGVAGFRAEQSFNDHFRWGIEAAAAAKGSADGYAEVLGTLAVETDVIPRQFSVGGRLALGLGGGGGVSTGGGTLGKASAYGTVFLPWDLYVSLEGGYIDAINGDFRALFATIQLGMELDHPKLGRTDATIDGWRWSGSVEHYSSAARRDASSGYIDLAGFKIDRELGSGSYVSAQAYGAVGGDAGGFAVGLAGLGWRTAHTAAGLYAGGEVLVGAAGAGGVDTEGGAIVQPMVYAGIELNRSWDLRAGIGHVHSFHGSLDSTVFDVSIGYAFGLPRR